MDYISYDALPVTRLRKETKYQFGIIIVLIFLFFLSLYFYIAIFFPFHEHFNIFKISNACFKLKINLPGNFGLFFFLWPQMCNDKAVSDKDMSHN